MNTNEPPKNSKENRPQKFLLLVLICGCVLALLFYLLPKFEKASPAPSIAPDPPSVTSSASQKNSPRFDSHSAVRSQQTAEEKVAARLSAFSKNRRAVAHRYAEKLGVKVPADFEKFFDAADAGNWEEINRLYKELKKRTRGGDDPERQVLQKLFPTVQETWGAQESAHSWPAQALLDYGQNVLGVLKPGMVYVGGTDPGRFIPTFLNETSGGENHIVLTQNPLADTTYLEYVDFLYGDRFHAIGSEESQRAFHNYFEDVQKRFEHDKQFPDEPKQMRPNENYKNENGRVQVSGQVPVMGINDLLLQSIRDKNPDLSFALEESFSLPSTYKGAVPLGPILELGSPNDTPALTPTLATESLKNWHDTINRLTASPDFDASGDSARAYAHMIVAQGNLFSSQNLGNEAEHAYRLAQQLAPKDEVEPTGKLYELLTRNGRTADAQKVLTEFQQAHPEKSNALQEFLRGNFHKP